MPEAPATPAQPQSGAGTAAPTTPAQTPKPDEAELTKVRDGVWADARKKYEPQLTEAQAKAQQFENELKVEREWRIGELDKRAKAAGVPEFTGKLAKEKGAADYEKVIAEFEKSKPVVPETPKPPVSQPGGAVGGDAPPDLLGGFTADQVDPTRNGFNDAPYREVVKKFGAKAVEKFLSDADKRRK